MSVQRVFKAVKSGRVIPVVGPHLYIQADAESVEYNSLLAQELASILNVDLGRNLIDTSATKIEYSASQDAVAPDSLSLVSKGKYLGRYRRVSELQQSIADILVADQTTARRILRDPAYTYEVVANANESLLQRRGSAIKPSKAMTQLAAIGKFDIFVSLSFDHLFEQAITEARGVPPIILSNQRETTPDLTKEIQDLMLETGRPLVFKLLGQFTSQLEYALTEEDVLEFMCGLLARGKRPESLCHRLSIHDLLILGTDFPDWLTRFFLRATRGEDRLRSNREHTQYVVAPVINSDAILQTFLNDFSASTLFIRTDPELFISDLFKLCESDGCIVSREDRMPHIFLSYASEDRESAIHIREQFDDAGLPIWMDENPNPALGLEAGAAWRTKIMDKINTAGCCVLVLSRNTSDKPEIRPSKGGRYFRKEWSLAVERKSTFFGMSARTFILPVVVDGGDAFRDSYAPQEILDGKRITALGGLNLPESFIEHVRAQLSGGL
jgi:hypothetical protein